MPLVLAYSPSWSQTAGQPAAIVVKATAEAADALAAGWTSTSRTARSRTSVEYRFAVSINSIRSHVGVSGKAGAVQWENGYCESFNGKLRNELLNGEIFYTLREAQVVIEDWRQHYNRVRPHSALGYRLPAPETTAARLTAKSGIGETRKAA